MQLDDNTKHLLVRECANCRDINKTNMLLSTPMVRINNDELSILSRTYDEYILQRILFFKNDSQKLLS